jgi:hypothetical protein
LLPTFQNSFLIIPSNQFMGYIVLFKIHWLSFLERFIAIVLFQWHSSSIWGFFAVPDLSECICFSITTAPVLTAWIKHQMIFKCIQYALFSQHSVSHMVVVTWRMPHILPLPDVLW